MSADDDLSRTVFSIAETTCAGMTGGAVRSTGEAAADLPVAAHDLTILMGLLGPQPMTLALGLDHMSACNLGAALLLHEADTDLAAEPEAERPGLMGGALEELANRIVSATAARLHEETGVLHEALPPVAVFGAGSELGGPFAGRRMALEGPWGTLDVLVAREAPFSGEGAP